MRQFYIYGSRWPIRPPPWNVREKCTANRKNCAKQHFLQWHEYNKPNKSPERKIPNSE